jgi:hypothetical protein
MEQQPPPTPAEQPEHVAKLLDALPGLIGAIDRAVFDKSGRQMPFVLLVFADGSAMHATNFNAADAVKAIKELAKHWDDTPPTENGHDAG